GKKEDKDIEGGEDFIGGNETITSNALSNKMDKCSKNLLCKFLMPDYQASKYFKQRIIDNEKGGHYHIYCNKKKISLYEWDIIKIRNKFQIILSNWMNVQISVVLAIIIIIINLTSLIGEVYYLNLSDIYAVLGYRDYKYYNEILVN